MVIALAYDDELSQSEIAERLDLPIGTVKTRTRRALRRLRAVLTPAFVTDAASPASAPAAAPSTAGGAGLRAGGETDGTR